MSFGWLKDREKNIFSQFGEDGVIEAVFQHIGQNNGWCLECGAADGLFFSNTRRLIRNGWQGVLVEGDGASFQRLKTNCDSLSVPPKILHAMATDLDQVLTAAGAPTDIDFAVIDVDGQDYYLFNSLLKFKPRVVLCEFNALAGDSEFIPDFGGAGQAGLDAIYRLGAGKFYTPVYKSWCNVLFVKQPLDRLLQDSE